MTNKALHGGNLTHAENKSGGPIGQAPFTGRLVYSDFASFCFVETGSGRISFDMPMAEGRHVLVRTLD
jgi:hypothetical protein